MTLSVGTAKTVAYKKETTWGDLAGTAGGKQLRRVTASMNLTKETYESGEILTSRQLLDFRHGIRSVAGSLNGELSPGSYGDFFQSILARDFTTGVTTATFAATIAASSDLYTITRDAGSFLTDGINVGDIIRLTGAAALNINKNLLVTTVTALVLTVSVLNNSAMTPEVATAGVAAVVFGKKTYVPSSSHTDDSYSIEENYTDIGQSQTFTGVKFGSASLQLPATGLVTVDFSMQGKDLTRKDTTQYFTAPAVTNTNGIFAAVSGAVLVNGVSAALITSADFNIERALENAVAVGSNNAAHIFTGRIKVSGNLSVYFQDTTFRDYFDDESVVSLVFALTTNSDANSDFMTFTIPKVKIGSFDLQDAELGIMANCSFQALLNDDSSTGLLETTLSIQDSTL